MQKTGLLARSSFSLNDRVLFMADRVVLALFAINSWKQDRVGSALAEALEFMGLVAEGRSLGIKWEFREYCVEESKLYTMFRKALGRLGQGADVADVDGIIEGYKSKIEAVSKNLTDGEAIRELETFFEALRDFCLQENVGRIEKLGGVFAT